jgi:hypothetical protein
MAAAVPSDGELSRGVADDMAMAGGEFVLELVAAADARNRRRRNSVKKDCRMNLVDHGCRRHAGPADAARAVAEGRAEDVVGHAGPDLRRGASLQRCHPPPIGRQRPCVLLGLVRIRAL